MQPTLRFSFGIAAIISLSAVRAADAQPQPNDVEASVRSALELLPDETLAAVVVPRLAQLDLDVAKIGGALQAPLPGILMLTRGMTGGGQALAEDRPAIVAFVGSGNVERADGCGVGFVPTTDYQKLIARLSPEDKSGGISQIKIGGMHDLFVAQKGDYAVFTGNTEGERKWLEAVLKRPAGMPDAIAPMAKWISGQDIAGFATTGGIKFGAAGILKVFKDLPVAGPQAQQVRTALGVYEKLLTAATREVTHAAIGMRLDDRGNLRLAKHAWLAKGGDWAKAAANIPPATQAPLTGLPIEPYFLAFDGSLGGRSMELLADFSLDLMKKSVAANPGANIGDDQWKSMADAMHKSMAGVESMAFALGPPRGDDSIYAHMFGVLRVADSKAFLQNYETSLTAYANVINAFPNAPLGKYEFKKTELEGLPAIHFRVDMSQMIESLKQRQPAGAPNLQMFDRMFGPGGTSEGYVIAVDGKSVVYTMSDSAIKTAVAAARNPGDSLASSSAMQATSALLSKEAQWHGFISLRPMSEFINWSLQNAVQGVNLQIPELPDMQPIGLSVRTGAEGVDAELVVPAEVLQAIGAYVQGLRRPAGKLPGR